MSKDMVSLEYRCKNCNDLLFVGKLEKGTSIEIMCKKTIKKKLPNEDKRKYGKCRTIRRIEV